MRRLMQIRRRRNIVDPTFITTWQTTSPFESITLPLISSGTYDFTVDWGDGSTDTITAYTDAARIHEYAEAGEYEVRISGVCEGWNFNDVPASRDNILDVKNWGDLLLGSASDNAFRACVNLDVPAADAPDLTGVTDLAFTFFFASKMAGGLGFRNWDVSSVNSLRSFVRSTAFNQIINGWDVSNVTTMQDAFRDSNFNQDISGWDVSNVTTMQSSFRGTPFNQIINGWDVSNVASMREMFFLCPDFNQDISGWDVSNVASMIDMLRLATSFNQNLGAWPLRRGGVDMTRILEDTALSTENYSRTLIGFANYVASSPGGPFNVTFGAGTLTYNATEYEPGEAYTNAVGARAYLSGLTGEGGAGWTITDGGLAP